MATARVPKLYQTDANSSLFLYAPAELASLFDTLATQWRNDTTHLSGIEEKAMHPAYQRIIGLGRQAVPFILKDLRTKGGHWFWALSAITGEDPIQPQDAGRVKKMAEAWLEWGKSRGYLDE